MKKERRRALTTALAIVAGSLGTSSARAEDPRCVAVVSEGKDHEPLRKNVVAAMGDRYVSKPASGVLGALQRQGHPFTTIPRSGHKRAVFLEHLREAAGEAGVDDVVFVRYQGRSHGAVHVVAIDLSGAHPVVAEETVPAGGASPGDAVVAELAKIAPPPPAPARQDAVAQTAAPAGAPAAPAATSAPGDLPAAGEESKPAPMAFEDRPAGASPGSDSVTRSAPRRSHVVGRELLDVAAGAEVGMRHFTFTDGLSQNLRGYDLGAAPIAAVAAGLYPFSDAGGVLLPNLGVVGGYARAFALQSASSDGAPVSTSWSRFYVGGRFRLRTGASDASPVVALAARYGSEAFTFDAPATDTSLPSATYRYAEVRPDARFPIGRAAITVAAGYLFVLSAGDVAERFPRASVGGVEAELGATYAIARGFEGRLTASYRRFFYTMNPTPGDAYVAGGALDQMAGAQLALAYVF